MQNSHKDSNVSICVKGVHNYNLYHLEVINISRFSPALSHVYPLHLEIHFNFASQCRSCFWALCVKCECRKDASGRRRPAEIERLGVCLCSASHHFLSNYHTHTSLGGSKQQHNTQGNESLPARWESINASFSVSLCTF